MCLLDEEKEKLLKKKQRLDAIARETSAPIPKPTVPFNMILENVVIGTFGHVSQLNKFLTRLRNMGFPIIKFQFMYQSSKLKKN